MFQDEAGFGRINKTKFCWCKKGGRPSVPCHHIREYRYAYGAVEPLTGESFFPVMPFCNTACMNVFLRELSKEYPDDIYYAAMGPPGISQAPLSCQKKLLVLYPTIYAGNESD